MKIASEGHRHIMKQVQPDMMEFELEAEFLNYVTQFDIEDWGYSPIVGSGPNASILHYIRNNQIRIFINAILVVNLYI